jgi:hypothetical protein
VIDADDQSVLAAPVPQAPLLQDDFQETEPEEADPVDLTALERRVEAAGITSSVSGAYGVRAVDWKPHVAEIIKRCEAAEAPLLQGDKDA